MGVTKHKPGDQHGLFTLLQLHEKRRGGNRWKVRCACGIEKVVILRDVVSGHTKSCGCLSSKMKAESKTTHGRTNTKEYQVWSHMIGRCHCSTDHKFPQYGARGILVCDRWRYFENFLSDMGEAPEGTSIDRIDNDKGYSPDNCRWADDTTQATNRRFVKTVNFRGENIPVKTAEERLGLGYYSIRERAKRAGKTLQEVTDSLANKMIGAQA